MPQQNALSLFIPVSYVTGWTLDSLNHTGIRSIFQIVINGLWSGINVTILIRNHLNTPLNRKADHNEIQIMIQSVHREFLRVPKSQDYSG